MHDSTARHSWHGPFAVCLAFVLAVVSARAEEPAKNQPPPRLDFKPLDASVSFLSPGCELLPIDLPTALRLIDANNPIVALAQARVREAQARLVQAQLLWLPNLLAGATYLRHDGQIQNSRGEVFTISRQSLFAGGGAQLRLDTADALFLPLISRRLSEAEMARARAVNQQLQLDAALGYLDLVYAYARLAINADILARAEDLFDKARTATKSGINKTGADINRAETEVQLRRQERFELQGRTAAASARLARLLLLPPTVDLLPADVAAVPVALVPPETPLDQLVSLGLSQRPELAAQDAVRAASAAGVRQAQVAPFVPRLQLDYIAGGYGGGPNDQFRNWDGRGDATAQMLWEFRNLGFGDRARVRERRAVLDQASLRLVDLQSQVAAEITEAAKVSAAEQASFPSAQEAVRQAQEMYRRLRATSFGMIGPRPQYDAVEPLLAIQALNQAQVQYLNAVLSFNRSQFQLFVALGQPALDALERLKSACPP
jgi:outer membrane protein TolC